jgi:autotransporter passenger strand-loop-strand repeat protein
MSDTYIYSGVTSSGVVLNNGDTEYVYNGGTAIGTTVSSGGSEVVAGGSATSITVSNGGEMSVALGGLATTITISGGTAVISGGTAVNLTISNGGVNGVDVMSGGVLSSSSILYGTNANISAGGTAVSVTANNGGLEVYGSGVASDSTLLLGGHLDIFAGGIASGTTASTGGRQYVSSGGVAVDTTLSSGEQYIYSGGTASGVTISNGGYDWVSGGTADDVVITYGGHDAVYAGGTVNSVLIYGAGTESIETGGVVSNATIAQQYGVEIVYAGGSAAFTHVDSGGELIISGGTATDTTIAFGGTVLVGGLTYNSGMSAGIIGGELDVTSGGTILFSLAVDGDYAGDKVSVTAASDGTALLTVLCFYPGTHIATPSGETIVEALRAGDLVLTANGPMQVRWLGQHRVHTRFADKHSVLPIRLTAGALGNGLPVRDLLLSPGHALYIDGILVQAAALVNEVSIYREHDVPEQFVYYHVELASHELLLAEGVLAESFVDNVDRMHFHNWDYRNEPPAPILEMPHPRVRSQRQLPAWLKTQLTAIARKAS